MPRSQDAEQCIPLPRLADYGLDMNTDAVNGAESEERASCVFARRILDEKRRASACFARIAYPYPPPPPERLEKATTDAASLRRQRERLGDLEAYPEPRKTDEAQWAQDSSNALKGTNALIDGLGENNPILKDLLKGVKEELLRAEIEAVPDVTAINTGNAAAGAGEAPSVTASGTSSFASTTSAGTSSSNSYGYGRRLLQRVEYNTRMTDALITHELMRFYGKGGIPAITAGSCEVQFAIKPRQMHTLPRVCTPQRCSALLIDKFRRSARRPSRTRTRVAPTSATPSPSSARCPSRTSTRRAGATCCSTAARARSMTLASSSTPGYAAS